MIFYCCATGEVDMKVMEEYSTSSFILAFVIFACKVGYPKELLPDAGSQLVKGCQIMSLNFSDIKCQLHKEPGVEFGTCPVGAHYMHVQESFMKSINNHRL